MKHVETIEILIQTLVKSDTFHALVIQSPPGWRKSTTIDQVLKRLELPSLALGSFTTPLHFYNSLVENPNAIIVLDDSAILFSDAKMMGILKAATWASSGTPVAAGLDGGFTPSRRVNWGSTSERVLAPAVDFKGKIIILTNVLPRSKEVQAFLSRCLSYPITFKDSEIKSMLLEACRSVEHFEFPELAKEVAELLIHEPELDYSQINLRTLRMGYELAKIQGENWRDIFRHLLPRCSGRCTARKEEQDPAWIDPNLPARQQAAEFCARTGKSLRTFYNYKRKQGLSRSYRVKSNEVNAFR